jgi:hypothetical protein
MSGPDLMIGVRAARSGAERVLRTRTLLGNPSSC